jgi:SAM-dependent methyltransferase
MSFNERAKTWDNDPIKTERSRALASEIKALLPQEAANRGFEFGCGTGLLSFELKDTFKHITLADTSAGMIDVLNEKIQALQVDNFEPLLADIFTDKLPGNYDAVFTLMTLHHIYEPEKALAKFHELLRPGGYLFIADLITEDGSFHAHDPEFDGHNGFDPHDLGKKMQMSGFEIVANKIFFELGKEHNGILRKYPLFLLAGKKV